MSTIKRKLFHTKAASIDEEAKSVEFVISTNQEDRYGEVIDQKTWNFKSYLKNPLILWGHDPEQPENVLGTASSLKVAKDGSQTTATLTFDADINPKAGLVFEQIKRGTLRTVSVGFMNHSLEWDQDTPILKDNELLEISVVPLPANPGAIALALKAGQLESKDAKWIIDSALREAELMKQYYESTADDGGKKEKSMSPEQATAMIEGMTKTTEALTALTEKVETLSTENAELKAQVEALKPAEETEEEKTAREAKEADEAEAKKAEEEAAAKKAAEDEEAKKNPAKSGDDDQDGAAETDELDEDAELTPELQAQIDAELEALVA